MKDAKGHGSDARAAAMNAARYGGPRNLHEAGQPGIRDKTIQEARGGPGARGLYPSSDAMRTAMDMRQRMQGAGSGYAHALAQGIKNLIGR